MSNVIEFKPRPDDYFGLCPKCRSGGRCVNVERSHFNICERCETWWPIGWNLFSSWMDESEADWKRNAELLERFTQVTPFYFARKRGCDCGRE